MNDHEYKIGFINYSQKELTWGRSKKLLDMYNKILGPALKDEEIRIKDLQFLLTKHNVLDRFFAIILNPEWDLFFLFSFKWIPYLFLKKLNINRAANSQVGKIFTDFFFLNKTLMTKLGELGNVLGMVTQMTEQMKKEKSPE